MYLKRLSLLGFKTFAHRTVLEFKPGISAIVGPNGCGKSNLFDAIVWVMGEHNVRSIRGRKMEEVVFHGTEKQKPLGYAQIELTFDNEDNFFPLPHSEVSLQRRYYRSGESEFFINNESCRLRDIQGLLLDTGLGKFSYSIISQGDVEYIINLAPIERRTIFDEAAGINKYKIEKRKTLQKIKDTEANTARLADIVSEIEERLGPLSVQAEKARRHEEITDEIENLKLNILVADLQRHRTSTKQFDEDEGTAREAIEKCRAANSQKRDEKASLISETGNAQQEADTVQAERNDILNRIGRTEEMVKYAARRHEDVQRRLDSEEERIAGEKERKKQLEETAAELEEKLSALEAELGETEEELENLKAGGESGKAQPDDGTRDERKRLREELRAAKESLAELEERRNSAVADCRFIESSTEENREHLARMKETLAEIDKGAEAIGPEKADLDKKVKELEEATAALQKERDEKISGIRSAEESACSLGQKLVRARTRAEVLKERISNLHRSADGEAAAGEWLKLRDGGAMPLLSELVDINEGSEALARQTLGGLLSAPVLIEPEAVEQITIVADRELTLIIPSACKPPTEQELEAARGVPGFAGLLADHVKAAPEAPESLNAFLKRVLIVNKPEEVLSSGQNPADSFMMRSGDGLAALQRGVMVLGGRQASLETLLDEAGDLDEEIRQLEEELEKQNAKLAEAERDIESVGGKTEKLAAEARTVIARQMEMEAKEQRLSGRRDSISQELNRIKNEPGELETRKKEARKVLDGNEKALAETRDALDKTASRLELIDDSLSGETDTLAKRQALLIDLKVQLRDKKSAISGTRSTLNFHRTEIGRVDEGIERIEAEDERLREEREKAEDEIVEGKSELEKMKKQLDELNTGQDECRERVQSLRERAAAVEGEIEKLREEEEQLRQDMLQKEMKRARAEAVLEEAVRAFEEEYPQMTEEEAAARAGETKHGDRTRFRELRAERDALLPVNQLAIEEYEESTNRRDFLATQIEDLQSTRKQLLEMVNYFDDRCRNSFIDTFNAINEKFKETFHEIFDGGEARIYLTDESVPLESGVEIVVQLPGKRMRSLRLLSGGEKALCALCFIFAILKVKPSPFYLLDEVDAGLDDQNVVKFKSMLAKYSSDAQFFLITHNKGTLEGADHLYGITMEEEGITKVLSVTLD
ncbi:MAG: chromosome segregation protein SMC [bacterium]